METRPVQIDKSRLSSRPAETPEPVAESAPSSAAPLLDDAQIADIEEKAVAVLKTCYDPEVPVNIYELGLIYGVEVNPEGAVKVRMTLTSPACPVAGSLPPEVEAKIKAIPRVRSAKVDVVWDPPWDKNFMSEAARLELGIFD